MRRVGEVELQIEIADAKRAREPRSSNERRPARPTGGVTGRGRRQQRLITPERPRSRLDPLAGRAVRDLVPVVDRVERAEAVKAGAACDRGELALADATPEFLDRHRSTTLL